MGEVTESQKKRVTGELKACEDALNELKEAFKSARQTECMSSGQYDALLKKSIGLVQRSMDLSAYINGLDCDEPPYILFQGNKERAKQALPVSLLVGITADIEIIKGFYFDDAGNSLAKPGWDGQLYTVLLEKMDCALECFRTLRKTALKEYEPREFHLEKVLYAALKDWNTLYCPKAEILIEPKDRIIRFDEDALYWTIMRMLRIAQYATQNVSGGWIKVRVLRHEDGNVYLTVENNGKSIEDMAKEVPYTRTDKTILTLKRICEGMRTNIAFRGFPGHTRACLRLPPARGAVTEEQQDYVIKELKGCEEQLTGIYDAVRNLERLKGLSFKEYDALIARNIEFFERAVSLSTYMNELDSDDPPYNIFQGNLLLANHAMPTNIMLAIRLYIGELQDTLFSEDGKRLEDQEIDAEKHGDVLAYLRFTLNCLRIFRKLASGECEPKEFMLQDILDKAVRDRPLVKHNKSADFEVEYGHVENVKLYFDKDALYWILMRMLSNAERATQYLGGCWIKVRTCRDKKGDLYLIVRNNGSTMKEMAKLSRLRGGGKSRQNIDRLCKDMGAEFKLKGFPDHTRACLRLPLVKEDPSWRKNG